MDILVNRGEDMATSRSEKTLEYKRRTGYASDKKYVKEKATRVGLIFFNSTDALVIEKLQSVSNKTDYIRQLILKDIESSQK